MNKIQSVSMTLLTVAILAGCNSTTHNATLDDAHNRYSNASTDPNVAKLAALELRDASDSLGKADQALSSSSSVDFSSASFSFVRNSFNASVIRI